MTTDQQKGLTINVSITDTDVFKEFIGVISKIVMDQRMPKGLQQDAMEWLYGVGVSAGTVIGAGCTPYVMAPEQIVVLCDNYSLGKSQWQHIRDKYHPDAKLYFIGENKIPDGLRPDKVVWLRGWEKSKGRSVVWLNNKGEYSEIIDETGDR